MCFMFSFAIWCVFFLFGCTCNLVKRKPVCKTWNRIFTFLLVSGKHGFDSMFPQTASTFLESENITTPVDFKCHTPCCATPPT